MVQASGTEKPNEKSIYPGSILENYIPEDVHTSFHIIKEERRYFAKTQKRI